MERQELRVLVGDDQIGLEGSLQQRAFLRNYQTIDAHFEFASKEAEFIEKAKTGRYDAFLIDLNWVPEDMDRAYKTGYRVLEAVRDYAPIRILHTSDAENGARGLEYGATKYIEKHRGLEYMRKALEQTR